MEAALLQDKVIKILGTKITALQQQEMSNE
jgi:hypothetical protein